MKKILPMLILMMTVSVGFTQEQAYLAESITPSSAILFLKSSRIIKLRDTADFIINDLLSGQQKDLVVTKIKEFEQRTGIDPLKIESLKRAGVDVGRSLSLAVFDKGSHDEERVALFVPVLNEKIFPLKFIGIIKDHNRDQPDQDRYPVIDDYRGYAMHQVQSDIFTTTIDGTFIIASTGELVKKIIDVRVNNEGFLATDPDYSRYLANRRSAYDLTAYATKKFLKIITKSEGQEKGDGPSLFNAVDYASMDLVINSSRINISLQGMFSRDNAQADGILGVVSTGSFDRAIHVKDATSYLFLSADLAKLEGFCTVRNILCLYYEKLKRRMNGELGIDFQRDFMPLSSGSVNLIGGQTSGFGGLGGMVFFFPMNNSADIKKLWEKSADYNKNRLKDTKSFGFTAIGGSKAYWYMTDSGSKYHVLYDTRGIFISNDPQLLGIAVKSSDISAAGKKAVARGNIGDETFFAGYIKRDSFIGALLILQSYRIKVIGSIFNRITEIYMTGNKKDRLISLDIDISLLQGR